MEEINNKILNLSTLTQENIITNDKNITNLKKDDTSSIKINMFNPIQYLIENPDVLIAANPLFANSSNTESNFNIYIIYAIYHLSTSPENEHRSYLPKNCN